MNILRRGVSAGEEASHKDAPEPAVTRRIEVTVERETVTMLVRSRPAPVSAGQELQLPELPAAEKDCN
ncbi:MAG: hypothetical protein ABSD44_01860 [Terracidiphilus sp.]